MNLESKQKELLTLLLLNGLKKATMLETSTQPTPSVKLQRVLKDDSLCKLLFKLLQIMESLQPSTFQNMKKVSNHVLHRFSLSIFRSFEELRSTQMGDTITNQSNQ